MDYVEPLREHLQKRIKSVFDLGRWTKFLFDRESDYEIEAFRIKKLDQVLALTYLKDLIKELGKERPVTLEAIKHLCSRLAEKNELQIGPAFMLLRVAVMGEQESLPLFEVMEFLGPDLTAKRLKDAEKFIKSNWPFTK